VRVLIDLPESDLAALDALAKRKGRSRAAEVREAVRRHLDQRSGTDWIERGFGAWRDVEFDSEAVDKPARRKTLPRIGRRA
jgi:metal-responsive CopG/Arc/MetJ family transcriptional regulator